jgi:hypothetical protein
MFPFSVIVGQVSNLTRQYGQVGNLTYLRFFEDFRKIKHR